MSDLVTAHRCLVVNIDPHIVRLRVASHDVSFMDVCVCVQYVYDVAECIICLHSATTMDHWNIDVPATKWGDSVAVVQATFYLQCQSPHHILWPAQTQSKINYANLSNHLNFSVWIGNISIYFMQTVYDFGCKAFWCNENKKRRWKKALEKIK